MKRFLHKQAYAQKMRALKDLRRDPHLAKDLGLDPLPVEPRLTPNQW